MRLIKVQQRKIGRHAHCHPRAGDVADRRCNKEIDTWAFESPRQTLHHLMPKGRGASNRNGIGVLEGDAGHDFIEPSIKPGAINIGRRLINNVNHCEARDRVAIEHVDDL